MLARVINHYSIEFIAKFVGAPLAGARNMDTRKGRPYSHHQLQTAQILQFSLQS